MPEDKQDDQYLKVEYDTRLKKMNDGSFQAEKSAKATLRQDDSKMNARHDPAEKGNEQRVREATRGKGQDSSHLVSGHYGARPDERNNVPFNPVMNRRFQNEYDRETKRQLNEKGEVGVQATSIHKAKADGTAEKRPTAIKLEREGEKGGELYMGNFSSRSERLHQNMPAGQKATREQVNQAYREDSKAYTENKRNQMTPEQRAETKALSRQELKDRMRANSVDGGKKQDSKSKT